MSMSIAEQMMQMREHYGITPQQLSRKTGVALTSIRKLEAGANVTVRHLGLIAKVLNTRFSIGPTDEPRTEKFLANALGHEILEGVLQAALGGSSPDGARECA